MADTKDITAGDVIYYGNYERFWEVIDVNDEEGTIEIGHWDSANTITIGVDEIADLYKKQR